MSICNLGVCYENGYGVEKDLDKALEYYFSAVEKGDGQSAYNLGACYYNDENKICDKVKACAWLLLALERVFKMAESTLNDVKMEITKEDFESAKELFKKGKKEGFKLLL